MAPTPDAPAPPPPGGRPRTAARLVPVAGLLLLAPISAEYLIGYDAIIGDPLGLLVGLAILGPLYGGAAVLIRELTRRAGRGWPTVLLLAAAFGLLQAGVVDQSLFDPDYRGIDDWAQWRGPTLIAPLGLSVTQVLGFVGGHVIWSVAAPIAVVEACAPRLAGRPWLGPPGLLIVAALFLGGATLIRTDDREGAVFVAEPAQMGAAAAVAAALVVGALVLPRSAAPRPGRVPAPWLLGGVVLAALLAHQLAPVTWTGAALSAVALAGAGGLLWYYSGRTGWRPVHVLGAAGAALITNSGVSFLVDPIGTVDPAVKYAMNGALMLTVLALLTLAGIRSRRAEAGHDTCVTEPAAGAPPSDE